jgi:hypothetical protein
MLNSECSELSQDIFYAADRFLSFPDKIRFLHVNALQLGAKIFVEFGNKINHSISI